MATGKGSNPRPVNIRDYRDNHDFIFGVGPTYAPDPGGNECAYRGKGRGKCDGQVALMGIFAFGGSLPAPVFCCPEHVSLAVESAAQ